MKRYDEANVITYQLMQRYPFTIKYRTAYTDGLLASGNASMKNNSLDSALTTFRQILAINRRDSMALLYTINTLNTKKEYDSALVYANQGLRYYGTSEIFLQKRATTLEFLKMYEPAAITADSIVLVHNTPANADYADYLHSKTMKDSLGCIICIPAMTIQRVSTILLHWNTVILSNGVLMRQIKLCRSSAGNGATGGSGIVLYP